MGVEVRFRFLAVLAQTSTKCCPVRLGADGVRDVVHNPMHHGLAQLLSQCASRSTEQLARTELLRTKYKPGRKLTAYYRLRYRR